MTEAETGLVCSGDGVRGSEPRNRLGLWKQKEEGNRFSPQWFHKEPWL